MAVCPGRPVFLPESVWCTLVFPTAAHLLNYFPLFNTDALQILLKLSFSSRETPDSCRAARAQLRATTAHAGFWRWLGKRTSGSSGFAGKLPPALRSLDKCNGCLWHRIVTREGSKTISPQTSCHSVYPDDVLSCLSLNLHQTSPKFDSSMF